MEATRTQTPKVEPIFAPRPTGQVQSTSSSILMALVGATLGGLAGGAIWGAIVLTTGYEIGYVAWAIGALAGYAVVHFSRGKQGVALQAVAVLGSVLGIATGKYANFVQLYKEAVTSKQGVETAAQITILSSEILQAFLANLGVMLSGYDLLRVALAVVTAWTIPTRVGVKSS